MPYNLRDTASRAEKEEHDPTYRTKRTIERRLTRSTSNLAQIGEGSGLGFLDFPPEVRNVIYGFALSPSDGGHIPLSYGHQMGITKDIAFGLLSIRKTIHNEAVGILYGSNTFRIDLVRVLPKMLPEKLGYQREEGMTCDDYVTRDDARADWIQEQGRPELKGVLGRLRSSNRAMMRCLVFAYHVRKPGPSQTFDAWQLGCPPNVTVKFDVVQEKPYTIVSQSIEQLPKGDRRSIKRVQRKLGSLTWQEWVAGNRRPPKLSNNSMLELADHILEYCNRTWRQG